MRKNIAKVLSAFIVGKKAQGDSKRSCWTDGETLYSYSTPIARWLGPPQSVAWVTSERMTATTNAQVRACMQKLAPWLTCTEHEDCAAYPELGRACAMRKRGLRFVRGE